MEKTDLRPTTSYSRVLLTVGSKRLIFTKKRMIYCTYDNSKILNEAENYFPIQQFPRVFTQAQITAVSLNEIRILN